MKSLYRMAGLSLFLGGIAVACYYYFFFATVIYSSDVGFVHNIGLLNQRQNGILFSIAASALGAVLIFMGRDTTIGIGAKNRICPYCGESIKRAASICRFCNKDVLPPR